MGTDIQGQQGFTDALRPSVAHLYDEAFKAKLSQAIPSPAQRMAVLESCFRPEFSFIASPHGTVIGIAGIQTSEGGFTSGMTPRMLSQSLGP